jgi:hypothetical protein
MREEMGSLIERYRGVSVVPRASLLVWQPNLVTPYAYPTYGGFVPLPPATRAVRSVVLDGAPAPAYAVDEFKVTWPALATTATVVVEHGLDAVPDAAARACREFCAWQVTNTSPQSGIAANYLRWSDGAGGTYQTSTADWAAGRPTGILAVDAALNELTDRRLGVG